MQIAFIGQKGIPAQSGGVEKHVEDLAVRLVAQGHDIMAYTRAHYTDPSLTDYKGIKLVSLPSIKTKNLDAITHTFFACLDLIRRKVDIVHFHSIGPSSLIFLVRLLKPNTKIVATFHCQDYYHQKWSTFARLYLKFGEWMTCRLAHKTITVSKTLKAYANNEHGTDAEYIPNGVAPAEIKPADEITRQWNLTAGSYILTVSRLVRHKGVHHLIKAFKNLKTDKQLVIVGEGAYTDEYVSDVKQLAADDARIIFVGGQHGDVLQELFSNAAVFVQPSESEGLSIALLEAMSYGRAIITSDIPENKEAIADTGICFMSKDEKDLEAKLTELLAAPAAAATRGQAARERAAKEYDWSAIVASTEGVYMKLMAEVLTTNLKRQTIAARFSCLL